MNNGSNRPYREHRNPPPNPEQFDMYAAFRSKERAALEKRQKSDAPNLYDTYRAKTKQTPPQTNPARQGAPRSANRGIYPDQPQQRRTNAQRPAAAKQQNTAQNKGGYGTRVQSEAGSAYRYGYHSSYRTKDGRILDGFDKTGRPIYRDPYSSADSSTGGGGVIIHNENGVVRGETRLRPTRRVRIETLDDTDKKPFPFKIVFSVLFCTLCVMGVLYTYMELNEKTNTLSSLTYRLSSLRSRANTLQAELVRREDLISIEQTASEILGMVKTDVLTKEYVSIRNEDKTEVVANLAEEAIRRVTVEIDLNTGKPIDKSGDATTFTPADKVTAAVTEPVTEAPADTTVTETPPSDDAQTE